MPFQKHVYYPLANSPEGLEAPEAGAAGMAFVAASAATGPLPFFQFRPRLESVDWRRLSAIDVDKVAGAVDVLTLQENIMNITFCKLEDEKCPHCQSGVDPVLLKLIRLAQLTIEYLMHSQDFLTSQLNLVEERLRLSLSDYEQSKQLLSKQASEIKLLKEECKRRKKMLSAQQLMIEAKATYYQTTQELKKLVVKRAQAILQETHVAKDTVVNSEHVTGWDSTLIVFKFQCRFCDKAFMNQAFLQSHIQRRHPTDSHLEYNTKAQTDKLQKEIDMLKEQLQLTKSQLESAQHAHAVRFSKEYEMQKAKEDDILKLFDRWKEEEKEKLVDEMEKVKEMFMKEFKELTSKNSALEYQLLEIQRSSMQIRSNIGSLRDAREDHVLETPDLQNMLRVLDGQTHKWSDRCQFLNQEHGKEKGQLLSHIDRLRDTVIHELSEDNVYYKKRIDELDQKLKEQNELILTQRQQINDFTSKPFPSVVELKGNSVTWQALESKSSGPTVTMNASITQTLEAKPSLTVAHEQVFSSHVLEPIEELSSEEEKGRENEYKLNKKTHLRKVLKDDDPSPKQLRVKLEKEMRNKLKGFGINPDVQGVTNETLYSALQSMKSNRYNRVKQIPNIEQIRESIELQLLCKVQERERQQHCSAVPSVPPLEEVPKPVPLFPKGRQLVRQRSVFHDKVAAPKIKKNVMEDHFARKFTSTKTPPFSSEEEMEEDDFTQAYMSPDLLSTQPPKSNLSSAGRNSVKSDQDWTEGSEMDDSDISPKPTGMSIKIQTEKVENIVLHQGNGIKPVGGMNDVETFVKKEAVQELKCTDVDDDDWDISSLEEEKSLGQKPVLTEQRELFPVKRDLNTSQVPRAWGPVIPRECKEEGHQENEPNTLKSSLVTMTDWSDFLDV